jgi:putative transposase
MFLDIDNIANSLSISRSILYYEDIQDKLDRDNKRKIEDVLKKHSSYGHKRIAIELGMGKNKILRVMKKFNIKPYRRRVIKYKKSKEEIDLDKNQYKNLIRYICPIKPNVIWASDFTYLKFQGRFVYLVTIIDIFSRKILAWNLSNRHDTDFILVAYMEAKVSHGLPVYFHDDQGSEFKSKKFTSIIKADGVKLSMSDKGSPWQNGFQESYYSNFKIDIGDISRCENVAELFELISEIIYYYNNERIHTAFNMSPVNFLKTMGFN